MSKNKSEHPYFIFEREIRKKVKKAYPHKNDCEISNIIAKMWIEGDLSIRLKYYDLEKIEKVVKNPIFGI